jgi:hypothetical protein
MRVLTKEEIILSFLPKERKKVKLPDLGIIDWANLDFLGWIHPSGHLGYIVYEFQNGLLRGIVLERTQVTLGKGARMCSLCYTLNTASQIKFFTYHIPGKNIVVGDYFCADLQCSLYIRKIKEPLLAQMQENLTIYQKIKRCKKNLEKFFRIINGYALGKNK